MKRRPQKPTFARSSRRGSVLLMVLVLIVVVSFMLVQFIRRAHVEIEGEGYYVERTRLRLEAWSMMEVAVGVLADVKAIDGQLFSPSQGWSDPLEYAQIAPREGLNVRFEFIDESAKLNLNTLDYGSLYLLFDRMGLTLDESQKLANVLLDWVDTDDQVNIDGAEAREYSLGGRDMKPANQPLRRLDELYSLIGFRDLFFDEDGLPNGLFDQLSQVVTTFETTRLNANSANSLALEALAGMADDQIYLINQHLAGRDGVRGTPDDNYLASNQELTDLVGELPSGAAISAQISVLTIKVTVSEGGSAYTLIGTVNTDAQPAASASGQNLQYPFLFLEMREEPGMNNAQPT